MYPSLIAMAVTGFLTLYVIYLLLAHKNTLTNYEYLVSVSLVTLLIGMHGFSHAYAEVNFGFNPLQNKYQYKQLNVQS